MSAPMAGTCMHSNRKSYCGRGIKRAHKGRLGTIRRAGLLLIVIFGAAITVWAAEMSTDATRLYDSLRPTVNTRLAFAMNLSSAAGLPALHLKVFDWTIGQSHDFLRYSFEGPAILELRSGRLATTMAGQTVKRRAPDVWIVPQGQSLALRTTGEVASLHGVVVVP